MEDKLHGLVVIKILSFWQKTDGLLMWYASVETYAHWFYLITFYLYNCPP